MTIASWVDRVKINFCLDPPGLTDRPKPQSQIPLRVKMKKASNPQKTAKGQLNLAAHFYIVIGWTNPNHMGKLVGWAPKKLCVCAAELGEGFFKNVGRKAFGHPDQVSQKSWRATWQEWSYGVRGEKDVAETGLPKESQVL